MLAPTCQGVLEATLPQRRVPPGARIGSIGPRPVADNHPTLKTQSTEPFLEGEAMALVQAKKQLRSKIKAALANVTGDSIVQQSNEHGFSEFEAWLIWPSKILCADSVWSARISRCEGN
jgi:hypothetical protein